MRNIGISLICIAFFILNACNNWLSVAPATEMAVEEQFASEQGVQDALSGIYILIKNQNLYGKNLTFGYIENMASLWDVTASSSEESFSLHNYVNVQGIIDDVYGKLYNVIANINNILNHIQPNDGIWKTDGMYEIIRGECLALRAFLHFDLMRLFGPTPLELQGDGAQLTNVKTVSKEIKLPIDYDAFKTLLYEDLLEAEKLLYKYDPIVVGIKDDGHVFLDLRKCRMNYYALKALQARVYLWYGDKKQACAAAISVISAVDADGIKMFDINGIKKSFSVGDFSLSTEHIWGLYDHQLSTKYSSLFLLGVLYKGTTSQSIMNDLYGNTGTDLRELYLWELQRLLDKECYTIKKYEQGEQIPLIRLSELYFIAIETGEKEVAQSLWDEYRKSRGLPEQVLPQNLDEIHQQILVEFRKEF